MTRDPIISWPCNSHSSVQTVVRRHAWSRCQIVRLSTESCWVCDLLVPFCGPDACLSARIYGDVCRASV